MKPLPRAATLLSAISLVCAALAAIATLSLRGAFPDPPVPNAFNAALAEARGWSLVTLGVVLPIAVYALDAMQVGSLRGRLVWLGILADLVYTYLEFAVSPPFSPLFLLYVTAFGCAIPALVMGVHSLDLDEVPRALGDRVPRRTIAAFALLTAALLTAAWLKDIVARTAAGEFGWPQGDAAIGHVVHALDLGLQVPLALATGILLLRRRPAGYVLAAIMLVNSVCMGAALTGMVVWSALMAGRSGLEGVPFAVIPMVAATLTVLFFRRARDADDAGSSDRHGEPQRMAA